ncbi:MAG TPA: response regulator [Candidatus Binataceae bacterium]|nr:response regulator [Candidatus Binataceae bacterium]
MTSVRILVAEDDPISRKIALAQLAKLGYSADSVTDGNEAIAAAERQAYDLILMDCQLPELDGLEATRQIRRREHEGHHPIIVAVTSPSGSDTSECCLAAGMDYYLAKPVATEQLELLIEQWLGSVQRSAEPRRTAPSVEREGSEEYVAFDPASIDGLREEGDGLLDDLIGLYQVETPKQLERLDQALAQDDLKTAERVAHATKSTAGTFGAHRLQTIALELETALRNGEKVEPRKIATFRAECEKVGRALLYQILQEPRAGAQAMNGR